MGMSVRLHGVWLLVWLECWASGGHGIQGWSMNDPMARMSLAKFYMMGLMCQCKSCNILLSTSGLKGE